MIPINSMEDIETELQPTKTYRIINDRISGYCDGIEAMKQTIYKILSTERFDYLIYSWNYGIETKNLYNRSIEFIYSELKRVISEALLQDDRIEFVDSFVFKRDKLKISVSFRISTIFGDIEADKEVEV